MEWIFCPWHECCMLERSESEKARRRLALLLTLKEWTYSINSAEHKEGRPEGAGFTSECLQAFLKQKDLQRPAQTSRGDSVDLTPFSA